MLQNALGLINQGETDGHVMYRAWKKKIIENFSRKKPEWKRPHTDVGQHPRRPSFSLKKWLADMEHINSQSLIQKPFPVFSYFGRIKLTLQETQRSSHIALLLLKEVTKVWLFQIAIADYVSGRSRIDWGGRDLISHSCSSIRFNLFLTLAAIKI